MGKRGKMMGEWWKDGGRLVSKNSLLFGRLHPRRSPFEKPIFSRGMHCFVVSIRLVFRGWNPALFLLFPLLLLQCLWFRALTTHQEISVEQSHSLCFLVGKKQFVIGVISGTFQGLGIFYPDIRWMEEILQHQPDGWNPTNSGMFTTYQLVIRISSIHRM